MQRPVTAATFAKKKDEDLTEANMKDINQYLDYLYEDEFEIKVKGARIILYLITNPVNLEEMAENEQALSILSRCLRDYHSKNMELTIILLGIFYGYSTYDSFHDILIGNGIGETCINIINFQYSKYIIRKDDLKLKHDKSVPDFKKELDKFLFMIRKQDRILRLSFSILINLADDPKIEKKMVKKDIVGLLQKNLDRSNVNLIVMVLLFLKKLSIYNINKNDLIEYNFVDNLNVLFSYSHQLILSLTLEIIYNLSFDPKFISQIIFKPEVFLKIISCFKIQNLRGLVLRILYNISKDQLSMQVFSETDCLLILYELLIKFPEKKIGAELAALTLNLTTYSKNCEILASKSRLSNLLERAFKNDDSNLIKIIKNIVKYSEDEQLSNAIESQVDKFIEVLQNKVTSDEFATELIEILSSIETNWEDKIEKFGLVEFIESNLENVVNKDLLIKIIMFIGNLSTNKKCSSFISKSKILPLLQKILSDNSNNPIIIFHIIYSFYNLILWDETRKRILAMDRLINLIIKCSKIMNNRVSFITNNFLEVLQLLDQTYSEKVKKKKFKMLNKDFIRYVESKESNEVCDED